MVIDVVRQADEIPGLDRFMLAVRLVNQEITFDQRIDHFTITFSCMEQGLSGRSTSCLDFSIRTSTVSGDTSLNVLVPQSISRTVILAMDSFWLIINA